jgi:ferric-dicitrate binding protein FerR (iron transport regulator)
MEKTKNIEFESLLQNEEFIRLINESQLKAEQLIAELQLKNPDKKESILLAAQLVRRYHSDPPVIKSDEITKMWNNILVKSEVVKSEPKYRISPLWMVAASVALLLSLSFYFFEYSQNHSIRRFADAKVKIGDEAKIIISDGSEYQLKSDNSRIQYGSNGEEIVIKGKNNQVEKLRNQTAETQSTYNQIVVPYGRRHSVTLCDGTVVQLNSGSTLIFPARFTGLKREVFIRGEGYFEVMKDASRPFIVNTEFINVKVLGTHFNISAYDDGTSVSAVLVEGSVEVTRTDFFKNDRHIIKPGQGCFFSDKTSELTIQNVDVNEFISWKDGLFQFRDQSLKSLTEKVEKFYNKVIVIEDNELSNRMISGKLVLSPNIEETLDFLARTTKSRYVLKEDGTFTLFKKLQ